MRSGFRCALAFGFCLAAANTPADDWAAREQVNATLWMQTAPEYRAIAEQVYRHAGEKLASPLPVSAALEQADIAPEVLARMPKAVVLDIDETVLDNTVYQVRRIRDRQQFDPVSWGQWVMAGTAEVLPGAREYIARARALGYAVFYITNRDCTVPPPTSEDPCPAQTATIRNLVALGVDPAPDPERMLLRAEQPDWVGGKSTRRAAIAANYHIVALVGDDLGDFVDQRLNAADRARLEPRFGVNWFLLPNPIYGSWANAFDTVEKKYAGLHDADALLELPGGGRWQGDENRVRIATWNVEYLMTPATHRALSNQCAEDGGMVGGDDRTLPCAITRREPRNPDDYAALRRYAAELNGDIVALQEVDGAEAAALVFPGYDFCFSSRAHAQKNGFAIRRGLPYRCEPEYEPLSVGNAVRRGVVATFFPGTANEFRLMNVHLKSGCPTGPVSAVGRNCELLSKQIAPLEEWIDAEARAGRRFGVLGDFNRRFSVEKGPARDTAGRQINVFAEINDGDPPAARLTDIGTPARFKPCTRDSPYREFIDTVLLGRDLAKMMLKNSFVRPVFNEADARTRWLSDHCAVGIDLRLQ